MDATESREIINALLVAGLLGLIALGVKFWNQIGG